MKKSFIKIIVCLLAVVMLFSTACKKGSDEGNGNDPITKSDIVYYDKGTHIFNVGTTEHMIVVNGETDYKIVYPVGANVDFVISAANEIRDILKSATSAQFAVISDEGLTYSENTKYISLGDTTIFEESGIVLNNEQLKNDGFRIVTKGQNIIINGVTDRSIYYGAFELLTQLIDYDCYGWGGEYYETGVTNLALPDFDVTDAGDFRYRIVGVGHVRSVVKDRNRMRMENGDKFMMAINNQAVQNSVVPENHAWGYFPLEIYGSEGSDPHPDYYSSRENELCYTAHGNPKSYEEMQAIALDRMKTAIIENPDKDLLTFTQSDAASGNCGCDACADMRDYYGSESAAYLIFVNNVVKELNAWIEEEGIRDITVASFAYNWSLEPPSKNLDAEELQIEDNLAMFIAPIGADFFTPINKETANSGYAKIVEDWAKICNDIWIWEYTTYYSNLLIPFCDFDAMQDTYAYYLKNSVNYLFCEGTLKFIQPGFTVLKVWLQGKLMWNVNSDYDALLDEFFDRYYDLASQPMRQLFDELRLWMTHMITENGLKGNCLHNPVFDEGEMWPAELLDRWLALLDQAVKNIESYEYTNPELYNTLYKRIALESLTYKFLSVKHNSSSYGAEELLELKKSFKRDCNLVGFSEWGGGTVVNLLQTWGI